ncbi:MAG TPA: hypothetical protein VHH92_07730 [Actinomycetota bacterium]|nr:hypothetical protein [Actinomycetota bacterium]
MRRAFFVTITALLISLPVGPAGAHEPRQVGPVEVVVGWQQEPAYVGEVNAVQVLVSRGNQPVTDGVDLDAEVVFGGPESQVRTQPIPLDPVTTSPGEFAGTLIPTRPGTYSFHITGSVAGRAFDETFTSGEQTFDDVVNATADQFPIQDPTLGELSLRLDRIDARILQVRSSIQAIDPTDQVARWLASGALALGLLTLVVMALRQTDR